MEVTLNTNNCIVKRGNSPKLYSESTLMYHIARELKRQGFDVFSKDLSKEAGNLLSEGCYGIIDRKRQYQIYFAPYCLRFSYEDYNKAGELILNVER